VLSKDLGISTDNTAKWLYESVGDGVGIRAQKYARTQQTITRLEQQLTQHPTSRVVKARLDAERTNLATLIAEQAKYTIKPGQLLIVDESSMSSTADLHQLHAQVKAAGGKMLLVGDPKQLDAVEAGGFLGWMENEELSANLTSVWRFHAEWEKQASLQLREGDVSVLDTYREHGRIIETSDALDSAYSNWLADTTSGQASVLIAGTNAEVQELNLRAQTERINRGDIDITTGFTIRSGNTAHTGDIILARQNNRKLLDSQGEFIKNGTRLTVDAIGTDIIEATREDTGATITIPRTYAEDSIELGYAATIHRAQGLTVETCHVAVDSSFGREQLYVAMTRGKASNTIYVDGEGEEKPESPDNWNMMHADVAENSQEVLARVLARSNRDKTAHETMDAEHGWAYDLGRAVSELDYIHDRASEIW
jgi:trwC relaxase